MYLFNMGSFENLIINDRLMYIINPIQNLFFLIYVMFVLTVFDVCIILGDLINPYPVTARD